MGLSYSAKEKLKKFGRICKRAFFFVVIPLGLTYLYHFQTKQKVKAQVIAVEKTPKFEKDGKTPNGDTTVVVRTTKGTFYNYASGFLHGKDGGDAETIANTLQVGQTYEFDAYGKLPLNIKLPFMNIGKRNITEVKKVANAVTPANAGGNNSGVTTQGVNPTDKTVMPPRVTVPVPQN